MEALVHDNTMGAGEIACALALGQACREAVSKFGEFYVIDAVARAKLIGLVAKVATSRLRSGHRISDASDIEAIATLAVQRLVGLESGAVRHA